MNKYTKKIGLGSVQFGMPYGISNTYGKTSITEVEKILDVAYDKGIRIIDTARSYGTSEEIIGGLNKGRFNVISKFLPSSEAGDLKSQCEQSLRFLKIDALYGFLAHRPGLLNEYEWGELNTLKKENKVKKIGYSLNKPEEYKTLKNSGFYPDIVQVPFNFFDTRFKELLIHLKEEGCEIHTRSTFLQGLFFIKPEDLAPYFNIFKSQINSLQLTYGVNLQTALLDFVLRQDFIDKVIIGVENVEQLVKNVDNTLKIDQLENSPNFPDSLLMPVNWPKN